MASRSINNSNAATQAQRKAIDNKRTSATLCASKLGLACASTESPSKLDGKRQLLHSDSGYISPTVGPTSNGNSPQTPSRGLQNVNFQIGGTAQTATEVLPKRAIETDSSSSENLNLVIAGDSPNRNADIIMQTVLPRESQAEYRPRSLPVESPMDGHHYLQDDLLLLAYECRQANMGGWSCCQHPYCVFIRQMSQHFNAYHNSHNHTCERCSNFAEMLNKHISSCTKSHCPIQMCRSTRQQQQMYLLPTSTAAQFQFGSHSAPVVEKDSPRPGQAVASMSNKPAPPLLRMVGRSSSFNAADMDSDESLSLMISSKGVVPLISSLNRANLRARAEEIVNRLDREEPLLTQQNQQHLPPVPPNSLPTHPAHHGGPMSLPSNDSTSSYHPQMMGGGQQIMLSPIAEMPGNEDVSPSYSVPPLSHHGSQPQFSSLGSGYSSAELDGPGQNSMGGAPQSLKIVSEKTQETEQQQTKYPKQTPLHRLKPDYLTPGDDGFYYKIRDYNLNETDLLGSGGFGSCLWAQDLTTEKMFAIKQNKNESFKSIEDECLVLSHLAENDHIIRFLGAVVDERELPTQPPLVCKMMMELAENGNLAEMLRDEDGLEAPLPDDQSLYYLQQILKGVNFLHQSGYLHLDIKAQNVLVFDGGRTVKLTDFGTAVAVGEVTSPRGLKGCTPYFAAPEMIKGEVPKFSADIWSVLCILVEMLTARWPGCHTVVRNEMAMMYSIGSYEDHMINDLISLNKLNVEDEVKQLFIDVFRKEPTLRPSAVELLNRPVIMNAVEYGRYFDECYDSEDAEELEPVSTTDIPIAEVPQQISLTSSSSQVSFHSIGDEVSELPQFPCNQQRDRGSQDSGVGGDLESSIGSSAMFGSQMSMRSSSSGSNKSNNQQRLSHQDSGLEDMNGGECSQPGPVYCSSIPVHHVDIPPASVNPYSRQRSSSLNKSGGFSNLNFSSLPQVPPPPADYIMVQRSYSFSGRGATKRPDSSSRSQIRATVGLNHVAKRHRPNSIHPKLHNLTHSYSAPSIGFVDPRRKRRHSLQHLDSYGTGETWEADTEADGVNPMGRSHLRRTSSEVYVDRGPDIDTPEKEKNRLQELLSGLTLGPAHPPKSSTPIPARRQMSDAGIQCDTHSATSSLSGSSTTSNELSDSKKQFDESGDHEDDHPPANGSQAFQIC